MRIQSHQGHGQGPYFSLRFFLDENILAHMAKGNVDQVERKMVDIEKRMIQVHMVMVKVLE